MRGEGLKLPDVADITLHSLRLIPQTVSLSSRRELRSQTGESRATRLGENKRQTG